MIEGLGFILFVAVLIVGSVAITGFMVWLTTRQNEVDAHWRTRCRGCEARLAILEAELEARPLFAAYAPVLGGEIVFEETDGIAARLN